MSADDFKTPTDRAADAMSALREHVGRVAEALDRAGVPALVDHVRRLSLETGEGAYRVPMGLIQTTRDTSCPYDGAVEKLEPLSPSLRIRVSHLVLSPDTAQGFDLVDLRVGPYSLNIGNTSIPLETFSIEFIRETDRLFVAQQWRQGCECTPAHSITAYVRRHPGHDGLFRGVLWVNALAP